ncbi:hypothetical protein DFQ59_10388 [Thioalbus denitrificans]|uniref:Uncharacterized protein n=2 Tax=Thioalbus denitrificans TaxID=547122 RepID=A0A369CH06_9GAMM|nr:hypothetical protein DFQ59_10388 [Thioalbus denitrificans]
MTDTGNTRVRFLGGAMPRTELLGAIAYPVALDGTDREFTRFYMRHNRQWVQQEFDSDIVSVCYAPEGRERGWWLLGKRGDVHSLTSAGRLSERIPEAGTGPGRPGYVKKIRVIGGLITACGYRRQVYQRRNDRWVAMAGEIAASRSEVGYCFNDIDGSSESDIYAVGNRGEIFHFDGKRWSECDSGTNVHLEGVACLGDSVVVAGRDGVVLLGNHNGFASIGPATAELNFWDVAVYRGRIFVSASAGVFEIGPAPAFDFTPAPLPRHVGYKLATAPEHLLSIGTHQIFSYDGRSAEEIVCPDNA